MANTRSAKKNVRQNEKRRLKNLDRRTAIKTVVKKINTSLAAGADPALLESLLKDVAAKLARAKSKRVIHPNAASRKLSRLAKRVAAAKRKTA